MHLGPKFGEEKRLVVIADAFTYGTEVSVGVNFKFFKF